MSFFPALDEINASYIVGKDCHDIHCTLDKRCLKCATHETSHLYTQNKGQMTGGLPGWEDRHFQNPVIQAAWSIHSQSHAQNVNAAKSEAMRQERTVHLLFWFSIVMIFSLYFLEKTINWPVIILACIAYFYQNKKSFIAGLSCRIIDAKTRLMLQHQYRSCWLHKDLHGSVRCPCCGHAHPYKESEAGHISHPLKELRNENGACAQCQFLMWPEPAVNTLQAILKDKKIRFPEYAPALTLSQ